MALDKLVDSTQLDADLTSVANAIRAKSGGSGQLAFPAGFVSEIGNIETGGGDSGDSGSIEWNHITVSWTTVTAGANTISNFSEVNPYIIELAGVPSSRIAYMFSLVDDSSISVNNTVVCSADATSYSAYRYRGGAYNKVAGINSATQYDAVIPAGTTYFVAWATLGGIS